MKRYFDDAKERVTLQIGVTKEGEKLTVEEISKNFKSNLREIDRKEYNKLNKEYAY
jgi:hypothetical protein